MFQAGIVINHTLLPFSALGKVSTIMGIYCTHVYIFKMVYSHGFHVMIVLLMGWGSMGG